MPEHGTRVTNDHYRSRVPNLTTTNHRSGVHNTTTTNHQSMFHNTYKGEKPFSLICVAHCFTTHQGEKPPTTDLCCWSFSPHQDPMASMIKISKINSLIWLSLIEWEAEPPPTASQAPRLSLCLNPDISLNLWFILQKFSDWWSNYEK